jgi:DNA-binding MarR family transcriptional regulator
MDKWRGQRNQGSSEERNSGERSGGVGAAQAAEALATALESLITVWGRAQEAFGTTVSPTQLRALTIVSRGDGVPLHVLAREMGTVPSVASRLCDRLDSAGQIHREHDPRNRRKITLRLTADGEALMEAIRARRAQDLTRALTAMSVPDREALLTGILAFQYAAGHTRARDGDTEHRTSGPPRAPTSRRSA